jgi:hypothetical protein
MVVSGTVTTAHWGGRRAKVRERDASEAATQAAAAGHRDVGRRATLDDRQQFTSGSETGSIRSANFRIVARRQSPGKRPALPRKR